MKKAKKLLSVFLAALMVDDNPRRRNDGERGNKRSCYGGCGGVQ